MQMRSCIYCGRELKEGEVCGCPQSVARRNKNGAGSADKDGEKAGSRAGNEAKKKTASAEYSSRTEYRTGYTQKKSKFQRTRDRAKMKRDARRNSAAINKGGFWRSMKDTLLTALRSPVDAVINPPDMSRGVMLTIWAFQGALIWLCVYFIITNAARGPFMILGSMLAFRGVEGYRSILYMLLAMLSGAAGGIVMFFLYTGVFYFINRFMFRIRNARYWQFCERLALTTIPFAIIGALGVICSLFSSMTLIILLATGAVSWVVLTYEALKTEWIAYNSKLVVYGMMLGFFILSTIVCSFVSFG